MRRMILWLVGMLLVTLLTGCGAGSTPAAKSSAPMPPSEASAPTAGQVAPGNMVADALEREAPQAGPGATLPLGQKLIRSADVAVKVKDVEAALATIGEGVGAAGGYVQGSRVDGTRIEGRTAQVVVRVPAGAYGSLLEQLAGLGEMTRRDERTQDVTEEYLDLDARIKTKEAHLEQLRKLYALGGTIKELMELEQEIARVTAELESIKGRFAYLSNQVAFSTISIALSEPGVPTPIKPSQTVWERMQNGFVSSWNGLVNLMAELAIFAVSAIPPILLLTALGLVGWGGFGLLRGRRGGRGAGSRGGSGAGPSGDPGAGGPPAGE